MKINFPDLSSSKWNLDRFDSNSKTSDLFLIQISLFPTLTCFEEETNWKIMEYWDS
jgi:hypothetical protein